MDKSSELTKSSAFEGLGKALRWMREKKHKKQYEIAEAAGITKAMLSAYETGKQRPTLDTLEKILAALSADLGDLFDILQVVNERPAEMRYRAHGSPREMAASDSLLAEGAADVDIDVRSILGVEQVDPEEEQVVATMVHAYHRWLRVLRRKTAL